jgi:hypothetical protein
LNLPATGGDFFTRKVFNCPLPAKNPSDVIEINLHNGFLGDGQDQDFEMSVITVPVLMLDSVN